MTRVLVLYYSAWGHVRALAEAEAEGARSVAGVTADLMRVPETAPEAARAAGHAPDDAPEAEPRALADYDAIIVGTPTRFGGMAGPMKMFFDRLGGLWVRNALVGKLGAAFTSTGAQHGGHEATVLSMHVPMLHLGMTVVGLPYSFAGQTAMDAITGGSPYGAGSICGGDGARRPSETELAGARFQGRHVATIARRLAKASVTDEAA
jgi:NAD(P)H dehydrogenase (quinone)